MQIFKYSLLGIISAFILSGCTGSITQIDEIEAFSYVKKYESEYQQIKSNTQNTEMPVKWLQASNKKEPCKLFVGYNPNDDKTLKDGYKIFWDGNCKNGYASGLGREFERGFLTNQDSIALYSEEEKKPEYFIIKDNLNNITMEGDINNKIGVVTKIIEDSMNFDIEYKYVVGAKKDSDFILYITSNLFSNEILNMKEYPNFAYMIYTYKSIDRKRYNILDMKSGKFNGFEYNPSSNRIKSADEYIYGEKKRLVNLPQSYINHLENVFNEIKNAAEIAIKAQEKALMIKKQYKLTICKDNVKVDFMDNNEYKDICNEDKKLAELNKKIDDKLTKIEQKKQLENEQLNQKRLLQLKQMEAQAATQQAEAARKQAQSVQIRNATDLMRNRSNSYQNVDTYNYSVPQKENNYNYIHQMAPNLYYVK